MNTLVFSLPEGAAIHVSGSNAEAVDGEISLSYCDNETKTPFVLTASAGLSEFFEFRLNRLQAARAMRFIRNSLLIAAMRGANTDEDQEPNESK